MEKLQKADVIIDAIKKGVYSNFDNGESGTTKLIKYKGEKYVLRKFKSKNASKEIYQIYKKLKKYKFLPELLYKKDNTFIFKFIPGKECKKPPENLDIVKQVAQICARTNKIKIDNNINFDENFKKTLKILLNKKKINITQYNDLEKAHMILKKRARPKISLDVWDVHQGNFILNNKKVYLIDIGGIKVYYKGIGIIKSYSWFKTKNQRNAFKKAYNSITPIKYLNKDYEKFLTLFYYIISIKNKLQKENRFGSGSKTRLKKALDYSRCQEPLVKDQWHERWIQLEYF